ncbi:MAG: hypothetical protein DRO87_10085 [Candidatus Thorarchaeota archaeon]|nr:MAG: hypothetical protein DRO87_10085 [Candidatus Thorarchaeota archaeon]
MSYGDKLSFQDGRFEIDVIQAGHFPGAIMTLFRMGDYSVIYTGDFNLLEFEPIASCRSAIGGLRLKPDVVICDGSAADLVFPKESLTRARLYSEIMHTWRKKKTVLFLSESNMGSIVTYFAIHENVLRRSEGRIPFYFDETAWDQMCILRERKDDLALSVREKIAQHRDPFHSVMIRALESEKPHLGGIGIEEASKTPCVICIDAVLHGIISEEKFNAIKRILSDPDNLVIVAGAPRSSPAQDLVACRGHIELKSEATDRYERLETRCRVLNWDVPSHHLFNYHPDGDQLFEFFDNLMPERIVFFHRGPNNLIDIRQELAKRPYVKDHTVIHRHHPFIRLR